MLNLVLLGGKIAFLVILYWFVFLVIRSSTRELRVLSQGRAPAGMVGGAQRAAPAAEAARAPAAWALTVVESPHAQTGWAFVLPVGREALLGRSAEAELHLPDTFVSSRHARVRAELEGLVVEDLGSTNGTVVNGEEISLPTFVGSGDEVAVGDTVFRVEVR